MTDRFMQALPAMAAIHALAVAIVNLTPTPRDDEAVAGFQRGAVKAYRLLEIAAGIIGPLAKR
jgi:hypothetical protein